MKAIKSNGLFIMGFLFWIHKIGLIDKAAMLGQIKNLCAKIVQVNSHMLRKRFHLEPRIPFKQISQDLLIDSKMYKFGIKANQALIISLPIYFLLQPHQFPTLLFISLSILLVPIDKILAKTMNHDQHSDNNSITESVSFSDSDDDMFGNLAPAHSKPSFDTSPNQQAKILMAKMKRLIGTSFNNKSRSLASLQTPLPQASKPKTNQKINKQKPIYSEEQKFQSDEQMELKQIRERSRDQKGASRTAESIKSSSGIKKNKGSDAANLSIQKQVVKQNDSLSSNKMSSRQVEGKSDQKANDGKRQQKWQKFAEMEKMLFVPVKELPILSKTSEEIRQEKREKKRVDRLMEKKLKEYKVGKVKDQASNCVFNGIEDYFN